MGTQKNRLNEAVLLKTQYKCLNWKIRKYSLLYTKLFCLLLNIMIYLFVFDQNKECITKPYLVSKDSYKI